MRTRNNKKRQHDDGRAGVSGGAAPRQTRPTRQEQQHPSPHQTECERAPAITAKGPATAPPLAASAGHCGGASHLCHSRRQRPVPPFERTRRGPRTIAPFADGLHAQLTFVAGRARRGLRVHPGRPNHITRRRRIENVRAAIRATWCRQPLSPVSDRMRRAGAPPRAQRAGAADPTAAQFAAPAPAPISSSRQPRHCARPLAPQQTDTPIASAHAAQSRK